jgi:pimeloyl-ACP methyl ester carboxylesterase
MDHGQILGSLATLADIKQHLPKTRMLDPPIIYLGLLFLALFANLSCVAVSPAPQIERHSQIELKPCRFANHKSDLLCGKYAIYENRAAMSGRMISLNVIVAPAYATAPQPDPVFFLAGGPGQGQARIASAGEDALMLELRRERDLIFIDQRGTGDSNSLDCSLNPRRALQDYFAELFIPEQVARCQRALSEGAELQFYTTTIAVEDLAQVRAALGYEKINLYGVSYGTLAALEYLRRYPQNVRTLALAGVSTPAAKLPLQFAQGTERAMKRLLEDCSADPACTAAFPNLANELIKVLAKLNDGAVTFKFQDQTRNDSEPLQVSRSVFVEHLRLMLYNHGSARLIPLMIHGAAQEDWTVFAKIRVRSSGNSVFAASTGVYFTVTCSESVPFITENDIVKYTNGTIVDEYRVRRHQRACQEWPRAPVPADFLEPVKSATPALMLSGEIDPATPFEFAQAALTDLPNGRHIILRNTPHSFASECARELVVKFITEGSAKALDESCAYRLRRPPFLTDLPERYSR